MCSTYTSSFKHSITEQVGIAVMVYLRYIQFESQLQLWVLKGYPNLFHGFDKSPRDNAWTALSEILTSYPIMIIHVTLYNL
jgi:hypothetical protein